MHGDLKLENLLVKDNKPVLADFGLARPFQPGKRFELIAGTQEYMAPEIWNGDYDVTAEMWALGVILFALLSGQKPFSGSNMRGASSSMYHITYCLHAAQPYISGTLIVAC